MVIAVRKGASMREAAGLYHFGLATVHYWVRRAGNKPLDQVVWNDRPSVPHRVQRTDRANEGLVLMIRRELKERSVLGEYGAPAIYRELLDPGMPNPPSIRTIGRILERWGALDSRHRVRHRPPPTGWYLAKRLPGRHGARYR